ncbi:hypothetical protein GWI33_009138 [Rhynchophorus ferrugineus]|uniref:Uncharacterized protein n=1 Tax=Rhynchophorus ferrugineus TaxID=354439 RepID=A0A834IC00_RHYFE|nr:hypothetical protein GWI33_009138 [Rhynchophorus ferrugineus]
MGGRRGLGAGERHTQKYILLFGVPYYSSRLETVAEDDSNVGREGVDEMKGRTAGVPRKCRRRTELKRDPGAYGRRVRFFDGVGATPNRSYGVAGCHGRRPIASVNPPSPQPRATTVRSGRRRRETEGGLHDDKGIFDVVRQKKREKKAGKKRATGGGFRRIRFERDILRPKVSHRSGYKKINRVDIFLSELPTKTKVKLPDFFSGERKCPGTPQRTFSRSYNNNNRGRDGVTLRYTRRIKFSSGYFEIARPVDPPHPHGSARHAQTPVGVARTPLEISISIRGRRRSPPSPSGGPGKKKNTWHRRRVSSSNSPNAIIRYFVRSKTEGEAGGWRVETMMTTTTTTTTTKKRERERKTGLVLFAGDCPRRLRGSVPDSGRACVYMSVFFSVRKLLGLESGHRDSSSISIKINGELAMSRRLDPGKPPDNKRCNPIACPCPESNRIGEIYGLRGGGMTNLKG